MDQARLIKSDTIRVSKNESLIVFYYYHKNQDRAKTFYRCVCRLDTDDNWKTLAEKVIEDNPAQIFSLKDFGLDDDYSIKFYRVWTRMDASRWLKLKLSKNKKHSLDQFLNGRKLPYSKYRKAPKTPGAFSDLWLPYIQIYNHDQKQYDLMTPYDFPRGVWLSETRIAPPRKKLRIIKD